MQKPSPGIPNFMMGYLYNDMKMKSGTINRVKGFTGYQKSKTGKEYIFSMIINNYNGSQLSLIRKMYQVLDQLK
ncbi:D-alanyl-D-alanine carboxypeptidase [Niabella sp. W65]|nr:D-alanyl-D-alanine carboxypeptidase [Niabella sp. W65]MCH7367721.1 D-alanyl-D-alanine carboxypeptidase [Niabella sp. W65]